MTEDLLRLMTAAVDGELTPAEAQRLDRALAESPEARALFARLRTDSARLRTLPAARPPADLHKRIMARVATATPPASPPRTKNHPALPNGRPTERPAEPAPTFAPPRAARKRTWAPFAVAAGVLFCVTTGSFLFFVSQNGKGRGTRPADGESAKWLPADSAPRPSAPSVRERPAKPEREPVVPDMPPVRPAVPADDFAVAPEPRPVRPDLIAFPPIPNIEFDLVRVRVPFLKTVAEFEREDVRQQLAEELALDPAFRIDLFARDAARGVEALQAAAKAAGLTLHSDAATLERIRKQRQNNSVVVYTEALTASDLAVLFGKLNTEDAKYSPRVFDVLHAVPASGRDADELRTIFGVESGLFKRPPAGGNERGEKPVEPGKSVSAATADQIVKSVTAGKGGEKDKAEKHAVLLTWAPTAARTPATASAELKQFLAKRGPRQPNVVPVVIVIRPGNR